MEELVIQVRDREKAKLLLELLTALDFVDSVQSKALQSSAESATSTEDFFALAGLWENKAINLETIRQNAWPKQYQ